MERPDPDALLAQEAFLRAIARPLVEDESQVDDVVQETWLKALEKPPRRRASLRSWLATVARNVALKTRRARTRRDRRERAAARPERDDIVMRVEGHQGIVDAVLGLAEPYRTMVLLRYYDRLTSDEIGARFGVTGAAVRKRLKRALVLLREALDERHGGNRRAWSVMLLPLLPKTEAAAAAAIAGGVVMGTKSKIGIAVVVVLLLVGGAWMLFKPSSHRTGERARPVATVPPAAEPATAPPTRPPDEAPLPEPVDFTAVDRDRDVHGVVVSSDGAPVAGARVETVVFPWRRIIGLHRHARFEERAGLETVTARDGTFALRFERGELVHVRVHADGYASRELPRVQAGERLRIVLAAPARLVVQLDPPVAGASVKLECTDRAGWWVFFRREGVTDDTGRCVFDDLDGGKGAWVVVRHPETSGITWRVDLPATGAKTLALKLDAGATLRGRVVDAASDAPVAGARVGLWGDESETTDAEGRFAIAGTSTGIVRALADGYALAAIHVSSQDPLCYAQGKRRLEDVREVEIRLSRGKTVTGRIVDAAGRAVAGARLATKVGFGTASVVTGPDGTFRLQDLPRTVLSLQCFADGHGRRNVAVPPETTELGDVALSAPGAIEGRVLLPDGRPLPHVWVTMTHASMAERRRTDDLGRYRFRDLEPGAYSLWAEPEGMAYISSPVELPDGVARVEADLRYDRVRTVVVRVETKAGMPIAGAQVRVTAAMRMAQSKTGADGRATLRLTASPKTASVDPPTTRYRRPLMRQLKGDETEIVFVLQEQRMIRGKVVDPDGKPVYWQEVRAWRNATKYESSGATRKDGTFQIAVPDGEAYELRLTGHSYETNPAALRGRDYLLRATLPGARAGPKVHLIRGVRVEARRTLRVVVLSPDGKPVEGAIVHATPSAWPVGNRTDAEGRVTMTALPAEDVQIRGHRDRTPWLNPKRVTVTPTGQEIVLRFREPATIEGRVLVDGKPAPYASVYSVNHGSTHADAEGRFRLKVEPDASRSIRVQAMFTKAGDSLEGSVEGLAPGARDVEITVAKAR